MTMPPTDPIEVKESSPLERNARRMGIIRLAADTAIALTFAILGARSQAWQFFVLTGVTTLMVGLDLLGIRLIRRGRFNLGTWIIFGGLLVALLAEASLLAETGTVLGFTAIILVTVSAIQSTPPKQTRLVITLGLITGLAVLGFDTAMNLVFRLTPPTLFFLLYPGIVGLAVLTFLLFILREFNQLKIVPKLLTFFLTLAVVPLGILAYLSSQVTNRALIDAANKTLNATASQTAAILDATIKFNLDTTRSHAKFPILQQLLSMSPEERTSSGLDSEATTLLRNIRGADPYFIGYWLIDKNGTVILDTQSASLDLGQSHSYVNHFTIPFALGQPYVSSVDFSTGEPVLFFASRIDDSSTAERLGVLVARYKAVAIQALVAKNNTLAGADSFGVVYDKVKDNFIQVAHGASPDTNYLTIVPMDPAESGQLREDGRLPAVTGNEIALNNPDVVSNLTSFSEQPFFSAPDIATGNRLNQVAVVRMKSQPWLVAFYQPRDVFLAPLSRQARSTIIFTVLIASLVAIVAIRVAQFLANPITRLTGVAERVTEGNLNVRALVESEDEIGTLAKTFNSMTSQLRQSLTRLEERVAERTAQLEVSAEVGRAATSSLDPDELTHTLVNLITDRFGYYYAAIFLADEEHVWAELKDATGEAGETLKSQHHRLQVGGFSMVGAAIQKGEPRIALDVGEEAVRFNNPLLPETRSEIALPLIVGDRILGALDVQSTEEAAFNEEDIETLQNMANQVAIAIENARLFHETQEALSEISRLHQASLQADWQHTARSVANTFQFRNNQALPVTAIDIPGLQEAIREKKRVVTQDGSVSCITVPLVFRDQVIGVINLKSSDREWTEDELSIVDAVARQAALTLENARLLQTTLERADRERLIGDVTSRLRETLDVEMVLQAAARQFYQVLDLEEVEVRLGTTPEPPAKEPLAKQSFPGEL